MPEEVQISDELKRVEFDYEGKYGYIKVVRNDGATDLFRFWLADGYPTSTANIEGEAIIMELVDQPPLI